jgi:hypothetical protein
MKIEPYSFLGKLDYTIFEGNFLREESIDLGVVWSHFFWVKLLKEEKLKLRQVFQREEELELAMFFQWNVQMGV